MRVDVEVGEEKLITREGTIIPMAMRFTSGQMLLTYHTAHDAAFAPTATMHSNDAGDTWQRCASPMHRIAACGEIGNGAGAEPGLLCDQYLWQVGKDEFVLLYCRTDDAGRSFSKVKQATVRIENVVSTQYSPRDESDPDYFAEPKPPAFYDAVAAASNMRIGGHLFGRVIRLSDGSLVMSCYCVLEDSLPRRAPFPNHYVAARPDEGIAEEAQQPRMTSAVLLRSEDEGETWQAVSTVGRIDEKTPFDGGVLYSEGFNETAIAETGEGELFALMRHGSYHLIWSNRSTDYGNTWQGLAPLNHPGVAPSMTRLPNGMLIAAWGRPGMTVACSADGSGRLWDASAELMRDDVQSQKYPWLVATGEDSALVFYDRRRWDADRRQFYDHGIYARPVRFARL